MFCFLFILGDRLDLFVGDLLTAILLGRKAAIFSFCKAKRIDSSVTPRVFKDGEFVRIIRFISSSLIPMSTRPLGVPPFLSTALILSVGVASGFAINEDCGGDEYAWTYFVLYSSWEKSP